MPHFFIAHTCPLSWTAMMTARRIAKCHVNIVANEAVVPTARTPLRDAVLARIEISLGPSLARSISSPVFNELVSGLDELVGDPPEQKAEGWHPQDGRPFHPLVGIWLPVLG